jgi:Bacterial Ig-like domain (group 2)/Beta xylosidase C-terminal Concanavalin A-like domain
MKTIVFTVLFALSWTAHATISQITSGQSATTIQNTINEASAGDTVAFSGGTYTLTSPLTLKCGVTYAGPVTIPATAEITTSTTNIHLMQMLGGCTSGTTTIEYLHFDGAGPFYADANNYTNINFLHNQATSLPDEPSSYGAVSSFFLAGSLSNIDTNITIEYNTFGDNNSCTTALSTDDGSCAGVITSQVGHLRNLTIKYNTFYHLGEGVHLEQVDYQPGAQAIADCNNCDIEYNYFEDIVRIWIEVQIGVEDGGNPLVLRKNVFMNPAGSATYSGMAISAPCCQSSGPITHPTNTIPSDYIQSNVMINSLNSSNATVNGIEMAGAGTQNTNNLTQGFFCNGVVWSYNSNNWTISYNTLQGPMMATGAACYSLGPSTFITNECNNCTPGPIEIGNVTGATPSAITSVAPTISPASGAQSFPLTVTLTDTGYTNESSPYPLGNTGIWYTTDGSTPVPGSGSAKRLDSGGTFVLTGPATVHAVGMWGAPNQPTSYPSGYGFVPSPVISAVLEATSGSTLVSAYLTSNGGVKSIPVGETLQFIAHGVYSDGTSSVLPDSEGNAVTAWNTSDHAVAKISTLGHVTAMGVGMATIEAFIGNLEASTSTLSVTAIVPSGTQAPATESALAPRLESTSGSVPTVPGAPIGDKFLGPLWEVIAPAGGSASISNGHLFLSVPGGSNHDTLLPSNQAVRALQPIGDTDFDVSIKIDSKIAATDADTSQGLMVMSDDDAFITFALTTDGTNIGLVARTVKAGVSTPVLEDTNFNQYQNPMYLRLTRSGDAYMASYSIDGVHWTQATGFTDTGTYTSIGPFDSNYNSSPQKAVPVVMSVDWFNVE